MDSYMKHRIAFTLLWMIAFAAAAFLLGLLGLFVLTHARIVSLNALQYVDWILKVIVFSSPVVALFLAVRGVLPGTGWEQEGTH